MELAEGVKNFKKARLVINIHGVVKQNSQIYEGCIEFAFLAILFILNLDSIALSYKWYNNVLTAKSNCLLGLVFAIIKSLVDAISPRLNIIDKAVWFPMFSDSLFMSLVYINNLLWFYLVHLLDINRVLVLNCAFLVIFLFAERNAVLRVVI